MLLDALPGIGKSYRSSYAPGNRCRCGRHISANKRHCMACKELADAKGASERERALSETPVQPGEGREPGKQESLLSVLRAFSGCLQRLKEAGELVPGPAASDGPAQDGAQATEIDDHALARWETEGGAAEAQEHECGASAQ